MFHFSLVSYYTNWFGVYQFTGIITAPFVGLPMDWKPKKKQNEETDMGFIAGYVLTSFVALTLNILVLVPVLPVQVIAASNHLSNNYWCSTEELREIIQIYSKIRNVVPFQNTEILRTQAPPPNVRPLLQWPTR